MHEPINKAKVLAITDMELMVDQVSFQTYFFDTWRSVAAFSKLTVIKSNIKSYTIHMPKLHLLGTVTIGTENNHENM